MDTTMTSHDAAVGLPKHYGVAVTYLGEEGEQLLAFTSDERRALAAMNRQMREDCGWNELADQYDLSTLSVVWVVFHATCGCEHADRASCRTDSNGAVTCCPPSLDDSGEPTDEVDFHDCERPGLPPCSDEHSWWMSSSDVTEATPGAVQVCIVDVD